MAILNNTDFVQMTSNRDRTTDLAKRLLQIESLTITWMNEATLLHTESHVDDKPGVLAMRADLIAKLTAAVAL